MELIISDDINSNKIIKQLVKLIEEFIQEQLKNNNITGYYKKVSRYYNYLLKKTLKDKSGNSKIYYIIADDKILGLEIASVSYSQKEKLFIGNKPCIYISKEYRGQKINGKYVALALDEMVEKYFDQKKVSITRFVTLDKNERQINVYKHLGYKITDIKNGTVYFEKRR